MFKLARTPIASAFRAATVSPPTASLLKLRFIDCLLQDSSVQSRLAQQQRRNLSIHEYLSARLLKSVRLSQVKNYSNPN